jgi:hypothetical protein
MARERLATATLHLRPQILHRAQLQLLDRPRSFAQPLRNIPDAPLLHEPLVYHLLLDLRKLRYQPKQLCSVLNRAQPGSLQTEIGGRLRRIIRSRNLPRGALGVIDDRIGGNPKQPSHKWNAAPFITFQVSQRFVKHLRRHIFCGRPIPHSASHKRIYALEMKFVECIELFRVALRRLHKPALIRALSCFSGHTLNCLRPPAYGGGIALGPRTLACRSSCGHLGSNNITVALKKGYGCVVGHPSQDYFARAPGEARPKGLAATKLLL